MQGHNRAGSAMTIDAALHWNKTGYHLVAGHTYRLHAHGQWKDASHKCGPTGYSVWYLAAFAPIRRYVRAPWFALIGTVSGADAFVIGDGRDWTAPRDGELWCYANDVWFMYGNNTGAISLDIEDLGASRQ
jgi:hypothetical protein